MIDAVFCETCRQYYLADSCTVQKDGQARGYICPQGHLPNATRRNTGLIEALNLLRELNDMLKDGR